MTAAHALVSAINGLANVVEVQSNTHHPLALLDSPDEKTLKGLAIKRLVMDAEIGVVERSLCEVIEYAAADFDPESATLTRELLSLPAACLTFERQISYEEQAYPNGGLATLAWQSLPARGLHLMAIRGPERINGSWVTPWDEPWGGGDLERDPDTGEYVNEDVGASIEELIGLRRTAAAAFTILGQRIVAKHSERLPRAARRHQRFDERDDESISVYHLRRYAAREASGGESDREYDHRWWVSGHWFKAAVGPAREQRRWTWRMGHTAGPPDKPFRPRSRVIVADR